MLFNTLEYENTTGSINYYYRNYKTIPFDSKISFGEYLAGDKGITFELSRSFINGVKIGAFASFTDVSSEDFGKALLTKESFSIFPYMGIL